MPLIVGLIVVFCLVTGLWWLIPLVLLFFWLMNGTEQAASAAVQSAPPGAVGVFLWGLLKLVAVGVVGLVILSILAGMGLGVL